MPADSQLLPAAATGNAELYAFQRGQQVLPMLKGWSGAGSATSELMALVRGDFLAGPGCGSGGPAPLQTALALRAAGLTGFPPFFTSHDRTPCDQPTDRPGVVDVPHSSDGPSATTKDRVRFCPWSSTPPADKEDENREKTAREDVSRSPDVRSQSPSLRDSHFDRSPEYVEAEDPVRSQSPTAASVSSSADSDDELNVTDRPPPLRMLPPTDPLTPASLLPVLSVKNTNISNAAERRSRHRENDDDDDTGLTGKPDCDYDL